MLPETSHVEEWRREEQHFWLRKHCAINAPKAGRSGEKTLNAAFPPNKTGDQIAQIWAVAQGGLCSAARKQQGPADTLQGSFIFTSSAPDPALEDLQHWQHGQSHNCLQQVTALLDIK